MADKKKNIFKQALDTLTGRDEKTAAEKAAAEKAAADKAAAAKAAADRAAAFAKAAADKAAADTALAEKTAVAKVQAENAAAIAKENAERFTAQQAAFAKMTAEKATAEKTAQPKKGIVNVRSLRIRKDHSATSEVVAGLVAGNEVLIQETWVNGKNIWVKLGPDQWAAMEYEGEIFIKHSDQ
jgi:hypothetical protein